MTHRACLIGAYAARGCPSEVFFILLALVASSRLPNCFTHTHTPTHMPTHPTHYTSTGRKTDTPACGRDPWSEEFAWPSGVRKPTSSPPPLLALLQQPKQTQATTTT